MCLPGLDAPLDADEDEVARLTARAMLRSVPPAVPGIPFLSGGMAAFAAPSNLYTLQQQCPDAPWSLSFSYGRALQDSVLKAWAGDEQNVEAAQSQLRELARVNAEAQLGVWNEEHPVPDITRIAVPKHSYADERRGSTTPADLFNW